MIRELRIMANVPRIFKVSVAATLLALTVGTAGATSIVAIKNGNDIFIGVDSKMLIENDVAVSHCKISRMNEVYLVFSGIPSLPASTFNAYTIAEKSFAGSGSIAARLAAFDRAVEGELQAAFEKLRTTDDKLFSRWYTDDVQTRIAMQVMIAGAEKKETILAMIEYRIVSQKNEPVKLHSIKQDIVTKPGSNQPKIVFLGMHDAIDALLKQKDFFSDFDEVRNINEWIGAQIAADPALVGGPVDIIKISPKKTKWIQRKEQCREIEEPSTKLKAPKK